MAIGSHFNVVVNGDLGALPGGLVVTGGRQRAWRLALNLFEQFAPRDAESPHRSIVQFLEELSNRQVGLTQRLEAPIAPRGQDPALDDLDADLGLVAGFAHARRQDRGVVVSAELGVGGARALARSGQAW